MTNVQTSGSSSNLKTEARRRLNLDTAPVDREGFKTPIKATKRKQDCSSSPSPKKSKKLNLWLDEKSYNNWI